MKYRVETVNNIDELPIKIFIENIEKKQYRCDSQISLIFVVKGRLNLTLDKNHYILQEEDVFLINSNALYTVESLSTNQICVLQLEGDYFNNSYTNFSKLKFYLNSSNCYENESEPYNHIKKILVKLLEILVEKKNGFSIIAKQLVLELVLTLINRFIDNNLKSHMPANQEDDKINSIIEYIFTHYKEKMSLKDISQYLHLNCQYVSRYFSKQMGVTLNTFISNIRLEESLKDINNSEKKITYIALENGFPNLKSYFKAFKDTYYMTPSKYRSFYTNAIKNNNIALDFSKFNLGEFENYTNKEHQLLHQIKENHIIDCNASQDTLNKTWKKIAAFGRAAEGMREELRNQLRMIQKDISFDYVRFHGILSDEMMVYNEDSEGNAEYNFTYVDELIDFLLEIKLKPFLELGFMPELLASEKKHIFLWKANISFPKNMKKWTDLIKYFINHLISRYGVNEVCSWYFQVFDLVCLGNVSINNYFNFFKETYNTIKKINPNFRIGVSIGFIELENYISFFETENLVVDFVGLISYAIVPIEGKESLENMNKLSKISEMEYILQNSIKFCSYAHENFMSEKIDMLIQKLDKYQFFTREIFLTEWNSSPNPKDLLHDTCYKAAFAVKNIIENFDKVSGMAYWGFSDLFEEIKTNNTTFHGGLGFITNNGIKKPIYYAYQLINKLGTEIIDRGDNFIVTKKQNGSLQTLAFNYCHFIDENTKCDATEIPMKNRYNVFDEKISNICFVLKGLTGRVLQKTYRINKENGSAFDEWLKIGAPEVMSNDDINYIKNKSIFGYNIKEIYIDGDLIINEKMQPHEVLFFELLPI